MRWEVRAAISVVLLVCLFGIAVLTLNVAQRIAEAATANRDSGHWTLSQTDVELLALDVAIHEGLASEAVSDAALAEIRRRFDIFYSRIKTVSTSEMFQSLSETPGFLENYTVVQKFIADTTATIDGSDTALRSALPQLQKSVYALRAPSRAMVLAGLRTFAEATAASRAQVEHTLLLVAGLTVVCIFTLLAMVAILVRLDAVNHARRVEVEAAAAHMAAIVATAQDAVITINEQDCIASFNDAAGEMFGIKPSLAMGKNIWDLLLPSDQHTILRQILGEVSLAAPGGEARRHRLFAQHGDGHVFPVELSISATYHAGPRLLVAFLRDLTAEVAAEQALVQARDEALAGERAKADLLAVMSHEIRTPLNGLLGTIELLGNTRLSGKQKDYVHILETSGMILLHHVNDVLEISRHDSGQVPCASEPVNLEKLAREVIDNQAAAAALHGSRLVLALPDSAKNAIISDARLLKQVLLNLVGNAVKFTDNGTIKLEIRHLGPEGPTEFSVSDTGIGIAPNDLPRIFEDFVTLDPSYSRRQGGTGLGLGIARRIAERLGGKLTAESLPGHGSTFRFTLAAPVVAHASEVRAKSDQVPASAKSQALDVLVIEDNRTNRLVLRDMLTFLGHKVTEAEDGAEGVRIGMERGFDVVLMDISMPKMDGLQATAVLRSKMGPNQTTPIIALTAHALPSEQRRFHAAGMSDVLIKPISAKQLQDILQPIGDNLRQTQLPAAPSVIEAEMPTMLARYIPAFIAEGDQLTARICALSLQTDEDDSLREVVHKLAGSASMFGADMLASRLVLIETCLKTGEGAAARAEIAVLSSCWKQAKGELLNRS